MIEIVLFSIMLAFNCFHFIDTAFEIIDNYKEENRLGDWRDD